MTSDEYPVYQQAIRQTYGHTLTPPTAGRPVRPQTPGPVMPPDVTYTNVYKERQNNRVVDVSTRVVFGTMAAVVMVLLVSTVNHAVNTRFVERHNGTDRSRCSRKLRKSYVFS